VFTGEPSREALLWAALLAAGSQAVVSHQTAAERFKITDRQSSLVHVTIPASRHIARLHGIVVHRSTRLEVARHPSLLPPRTRIEETVLDLVVEAATFDAAFAIACAACQRRLTTSGRLAEAMNKHKKMRWRAELSAAIAEIGSGVHSLLEFKYVRDVERPHGLPQASRQARSARDGRSSPAHQCGRRDWHYDAEIRLVGHRPQAVSDGWPSRRSPAPSWLVRIPAAMRS